jgi:hypothetical protein
MDPSADRHTTDAFAERDREPPGRLIASVLRRAHLEAEARSDADEPRAILHVAHSSADELVAADPRFDRPRFIVDATEDSSRGPT